MKIKKLIGQIHLWLGLASGIVVVILGITGCILAFEDELKDLLYADKLFVDALDNQQAIPLSKSLEIAQNTLDSGYSVQSIKIYNASGHSLSFRNFTLDTNSNSIWSWNELEYCQEVYVNPYTAKILAQEDPTFEFFNIVLKLHWSLLLINDIGQPIIGIATLIFVVMLFTGIILWWPKNKAALKQRVWFRWKNTMKWKRKNYDLHNILGSYSMLLLLVIAFTGLVWAFDWFDNSVQWIANGGQTIEKTKQIYLSDTSKTAMFEPLDKVYAFLKSEHHEAESYIIRLPEEEQSVFTIFVNYPGGLSKDLRLYFDQYSGEQIASLGWEDKTNGEKMRNLNYDIHLGIILGLPGRMLAFCLGLIAASLPITGFFVWWGRKKKNKA